MSQDPGLFDPREDLPLDASDSEGFPSDLRFRGSRGDEVTGWSWRVPDARAALLFLHWGFGGAGSFAAEAAAWATAGVSGICIDAPGYGRRPGGLPRLDRAADARDFLLRCVSDLRRATRVLRERHPGVPLGYVGHSLGASVGGALLGAEPTLTCAVLMGGYGEPSRDWPLRPSAAHVEALGPLDGVRQIGASKAAILLQFGERDGFVPRPGAERFVAALPGAGEAAWYPCGHAFSPDATVARAAFLARHLGVAAPAEASLRQVALPLGERLRCQALTPVVWAMGLVR